MDYKQKYREETNKEPYKNVEDKDNFTLDYVKWLEKQLALCNVSCSRRVSNDKLNDKTYNSLNKLNHKNEDARQGYFKGYKNGAIWMRKQYEN